MSGKHYFLNGRIAIQNGTDDISWKTLKTIDSGLYEVGKQCEKALKDYLKANGNKQFAQYFNEQGGSFDGYF